MPSSKINTKKRKTTTIPSVNTIGPNRLETTRLQVNPVIQFHYHQKEPGKLQCQVQRPDSQNVKPLPSLQIIIGSSIRWKLYLSSKKRNKIL